MKLIIQSIIILIVFTVLTGLVYPFLITGIAQIAFPKQSNGSLVMRNGKIAGSGLIGQLFTNDIYFWGRPSASDYDATNSGGYNYGPTSSNLINMVSNRILDIRRINNLPEGAAIPADMALASASGLDPDISVSNAMIQAGRIAKIRNLNINDVKILILSNRENILSEQKVNVLKLNLALDKLAGVN